ncbi:sugar phosphate isomerase/epimerase [Maribellus luteus]|uniref:Sugar phosphate isomerase/epimerase n=1 Tax=Maribellus luteus TaxID=2305463 RepID=A0A399T6W3_9BACT|nr:sugar phosphate isomerase/epimerase family protein [Maribellus luteus]RIJ49901.1 sugar phosphate isomerase/epimerase [Maribellus luteus]
MKSSRRNFMKSMLAVPFAASGLQVLATEMPSVWSKLGHKFKISLNLYSFNKLLLDKKIDLFDVLDFCAEHNFDAIDPTGYYFPGYPDVPGDEFMMKFKKQAFLLGLDISGTGVRNDFANPDENSREADVVMIKKWVRAAAKMGIPNVRVFAGTNQHTGYSRNQVFEWMAKDLKTCCDFAKQYGVIIAIQNHNDFIKTAADVDRIFEMVDSEWLGLNLDIGSYRQHDPFDEIQKNIKYAVTWQIKENMWMDGKETPTDFKKLFKIIKDKGYRGYLPLETLGEGDPYQKVPALLDKVNNTIQQL